MTLRAEDIWDDDCNPLDGIEDVLTSEKFAFHRMNRDELFAEVQGRYGVYRMMFAWDDSAGAMQFCCEYDFSLSESQALNGYKAVAHMNSNLWLGHFDLNPERLQPCFRHTQLFRGESGSGADHLQDIMAIAVEECDKHFPAFYALTAANDSACDSMLDFSLLAPLGHS
jgi:hypothetical protein